MANIDFKQFRSALGQFATGVTVITTRDKKGVPFGVTANSFNSVSLDPPMVLWSLAKTSSSMEAFSSAESFAVHILSAGQQDLSNRFAKSGGDKFAGLNLPKSGLPLLEGCAARFICRTAYKYEGGDHIIFVGEVEEFDADSSAPLLFIKGQYAEMRRAGSANVEGIDPEHIRIGTQSLTFLLSSAVAHLAKRLETDLAECDMTRPQFRILTVIAHLVNPAWAEVCERVESNSLEASDSFRDDLLERGWIVEKDGGLCLTDEGRIAYYRALGIVHTIENDFSRGLSDGELAEARYVLERIIDQMADRLPSMIQQ